MKKIHIEKDEIKNEIKKKIKKLMKKKKGLK